MTDGALVCGVDEVGRGPLLGAVVTAAVILDKNKPIEGLADSKKLSEKKREALASEIKSKALCYAYGRAEANEIDELNILQASLLAMRRAVLNLVIAPTHVLVDGKFIPELPMSCDAIIGGDATVDEIKAASILAKVARDSEMIALDKRYPLYGFKNHKGYPTKAHLAAIERLGVLPMYRKSFKPVKRLLQAQR